MSPSSTPIWLQHILNPIPFKEENPSTNNNLPSLPWCPNYPQHGRLEETPKKRNDIKMRIKEKVYGRSDKSPTSHNIMMASQRTSIVNRLPHSKPTTKPGCLRYPLSWSSNTTSHTAETRPSLPVTKTCSIHNCTTTCEMKRNGKMYGCCTFHRTRHNKKTGLKRRKEIEMYNINEHECTHCITARSNSKTTHSYVLCTLHREKLIEAKKLYCATNSYLSF